MSKPFKIKKTGEIGELVDVYTDNSGKHVLVLLVFPNEYYKQRKILGYNATVTGNDERKLVNKYAIYKEVYPEEVEPEGWQLAGGKRRENKVNHVLKLNKSGILEVWYYNKKKKTRKSRKSSRKTRKHRKH